MHIKIMMKKFILCIILCLFSFNVYASHKCSTDEFLYPLLDNYLYLMYGFKPENAFKVFHSDEIVDIYNFLYDEKEKLVSFLWEKGADELIIYEILRNVELTPILDAEIYFYDENFLLLLKGDVIVSVPLLKEKHHNINQLLLIDEIEGSCKIMEIFTP